jgi:hypothetical protein
MMEQDRQEAVKLSRELNCNKRRKTVVPPRTMETRGSKKARMDKLQKVTAPETPNQSLLHHDSSAAQISSSNSDSAPENPSSSELGMHGPSPMNITTSPLVGNKPSFNFTLSLSISNCISLPIQVDQPSLAIDDTLFSSHVGQNLNGTWFTYSSNKSTSPATSLGENARNTRCTKRLKLKSSGDYIAEMSDDGTSNSHEQPRRRQLKKRKVDDGELPFQENQSSPEPMEDIEEKPEKKPASKRKPSTKVSTSGPKSHKVLPYHENVQEGKPDPIGEPEVWAFKRQQLCETLPYYNAYQSGAYTHDGIVRSILIDKEVSVRDKFDEDIIITSV